MPNPTVSTYITQEMLAETLECADLRRLSARKYGQFAVGLMNIASQLKFNSRQTMFYGTHGYEPLPPPSADFRPGAAKYWTDLPKSLYDQFMSYCERPERPVEPSKRLEQSLRLANFVVFNAADTDSYAPDYYIFQHAGERIDVAGNIPAILPIRGRDSSTG